MASAAFHFEQAGQIDQMVQAGYQAASQAERAGMYHTALMLYQKLRPHVSIEELGPRLAGVLIVLGDWGEAEKLTGLLPVEDSQRPAAPLRARVRPRGFRRRPGRSRDGAHRQFRRTGPRCSSAWPTSRCTSAISAKRSVTGVRLSTWPAPPMPACAPAVTASWPPPNTSAATSPAAETRFGDALELLEGLPEADRDRMIHSTILANLGTVAETTQEWAAAEHHHREALRLRREIADARGVLQSLHALGRARLGAGDRDDAERYFAEAETARGKPRRNPGTREDLAHPRRAPAARRRRQPRPGTRHQRPGDLHPVAHPLRHHPRQGHTEQSRTRIRAGTPGSPARSTGPFGGPGDGLRPAVRAVPGGRLRPCRAHRRRSDRLRLRRRARRALGKPAHPNVGAAASQIEQLPAREGWPRGATSDDTALTLLVAHHLADRDGDGDPAAFLADLAEQEPAIRGLGPTTTAAIERFRRGDEAADSPGRATNGAAMRALPIGWVLPHDQAERRRQVTIAMSRATHADPAALVAACVIAACASWALEGASPSMLLEAAAEEAREAAQAVTTDARLAEMLTQVSAGTWEPPANGISLDPYETVAAVLWCATRATSLRSGLVSAVQLGGDTDTVAALVGGLMGGKLTAEQVRAELPWHQLVVLPEPESAIAETAAALATTRAIQSV